MVPNFHPQLVMASALVFVLAFGLTAFLVPSTRSLARRLGIMDTPGPRKIHSDPTPRAGGIAVFVTFTLVVAAGYVSAGWLGEIPWLVDNFGEAIRYLERAHTIEGRLLAVLAAGSVAFSVGLTDDILGSRFPVLLKAAGQVAAAAILLFAGVRISFTPFDSLDYAITLVWVVGITNAFNLLDNMDGLSAGVAFVASLVLLANAWLLGEFFVSLMLLAFMGSLAGFLLFNFTPASVFLGDCGSHFIGFTLAYLTILETYVPRQGGSVVPVLLPVLVLAIPILDTATVVFIRLREGRPIYVGDRCHLSHQLVALGFSQRSAVLVIYLATFTLGLGAIDLADSTPWRTALTLTQSGCFVSIILILMFGSARARARSLS